MSSNDLPVSLAFAPRQKLAETVAKQLLEAIKQLPSGARLPSEKELQRSLKVGRSTVREALNGLAMMGLVEIRHGQGAFVAAEEPANVGRGEASAIAQALAKGVTRDLLEAREIVEVAIARLAAARRTEADIQEIADVLAAHRRAIRLGQSPIDVASDFHVLLAAAAHNEVLAGMFQSFMQLMLARGPQLYAEIEGFAGWELEQHEQIFAAVREGNAELAAEQMHAHVAAMAGNYRRVGSV